MKPEISIIIPIRNGERHISACITSVQKSIDSYLYRRNLTTLQSSKNFIEILVIDNNSTDNTKGIILEFCEKYKNITYVFEKFVGRGRARSTGEHTALGKIILCTDIDCVVDLDWVYEMTEPILDGTTQVIQGQEKLSLDISKNTYWSRGQQHAVTKKQSISIDTKNFSILADTLRSIGGIDPHFKALIDSELGIRLKIANIPIFFNEKSIVYHQHASTLLEVVRKNIYRGFWATMLYTKHKEALTKKDLDTYCLTFHSFISFTLGAFNVCSREDTYKIFNLVTGYSWRIGVLCGFLFGVFKNVKLPYNTKN